MVHTEMPAWKQTADCIWNSFQASQKKHLLLTGGRGSGKTTLLRQLIPGALPGVTTRAIPGSGVYLRENLTEKTALIGRFDPSLPGSENKMRLIPQGFFALGIPALQRCMASTEAFVSVDEIGYLEQSVPEYQAAVWALFEKKRVIAVVRRQSLPFLQKLLCREDAFVIDLDQPFGTLGCVIMASGEGKRFGGNKLMAPFGGRPLISWILRAADFFPRRVVVTRHPEVAALCERENIPVVLHDCPLRSDTVRLGVEYLTGCSGWIFCPGDQPLISRDSLISLALLAGNDPVHIWRAAFDGCPGAPVVFPGWAYSELVSLPAGKGGGVLTKKYPEKVCCFSVGSQLELADVDTPEALEKLEKQLQGMESWIYNSCGKEGKTLP